jgi:hypothetical protein
MLFVFPQQPMGNIHKASETKEAMGLSQKKFFFSLIFLLPFKYHYIITKDPRWYGFEVRGLWKTNTPPWMGAVVSAFECHT